MNVGFLHPGSMGETLASSCSAPTLWVGEGRSAETRARATTSGMNDAGTLAALCAEAEVVIAICPPSAAVDVANQVASAGYAGLYVDANAISPATSRLIADRFDHYVDGCVIGPPARHAGTTRLYLSGERSAEVAALYAGGVVDARVIGPEPGAASAIKMAYASWTKIGGALQLAIRALAHAEGVDEALVDEWNISQPGMVDRSAKIAAGVAPKAWRFTGEMDQIAAAFTSAGLPAGFAAGASTIYERLGSFKGATNPSLDEVIAELL